MAEVVLPGPIEVVATTPVSGVSKMADVPANIHEQTLSRLSSVGAFGHEHFAQFGKILDLNYETDRKMVSLVQSLGVREVTSQAGQTGVPLAGGVAKAG